MTSAKPDHKRTRLNVVRGMSAVGAVALTLALPHPAAAAPAPCERAEEYAAQSGAEFLSVFKLDGPHFGRVSNAGLAEAKSALVADATVNSAAVTRLLDADKVGDATEPLIEQAPPTNATAARRPTESGEVGPLTFGSGSLASHAQWDPRMACGRAGGEVTRAEAAVREAGIGDLIRVPQKIRSRSTTALAAGGRTMAAAGITVTRFDLLDGAVHVKVLRPPMLTARMSTKDGGTVRYVPAIIEVSGKDLHTTRLVAPGDTLELAVRGRYTRAESSTLETVAGGPSLPLPAVRGLPRLGGQEESAHVGGSGTRLQITLGNVRQATAGHAIAAKATAIRITITEARANKPAGKAASKPTSEADAQSADEAGGKAAKKADGKAYDRQVDMAHAQEDDQQADKADAQAPNKAANRPANSAYDQAGGSEPGLDGYGGTASDRGRLSLDLGIGLLEAAAVAPAPRDGGIKGNVQGAVSPAVTGAGLPITGSPVAFVAIGGIVLVIAGAAALVFGARRRRIRP